MMLEAADLAALTGGVAYRFVDWPIGDVPNTPGIYTIWQGDRFLYVGIAGRGAAGSAASSNSGGLWGRLNSHASGRRSGDQFNIYVCDRLVLLTVADRVNEIAEGRLSLDHLTQAFVRANLSFRLLPTDGYQSALAIETEIKERGLPYIGRPMLNPGSAPD